MKSPAPLFTLTAIALATFASAHLAAAATGFSLKDHPGESLDVIQNGKLIARYMDAHDTSTPARSNETYKPFLQVFDENGVAPITKGAGGSYTHHRGIFIGWNKIGVGGKVYDRWHMKGGDQVHEKFLSQQAGTDRASFTSLVRWTGEKQTDTIIEEERTLTFLPAPTPAYAVIDMVSKLKAVAGETKLDGDPEHSGLHFRPADELDRTKTTYLYPVENANAHKDRGYPWFGESFTLKDQRYSVVYLNHPSNPKDAAASAYRDYGRFGAFWKATIPANGTAEFRARFLVIAGELPAREFIQKAWNEYAGANEPVPKVTAKPAEYGNSPDSKKKDAKPAATPVPKPVAPAPAPAESAATAEEKKPVVAKLSEDPAIAAAQSAKRAGGGPETPELHFRPPAPRALSPQEELKTIKVAPGFKVELVASEPMIESPVAISWDDQGRMYVCEMRNYMHDVDGAGEEEQTGRISRLEDTNGDGVMDKSTVFVDKLVMPRAVMALGDGAVVSEPPILAWYRDTDGDGVADKKEIISEKYATAGGQPEHMANSPTWMMNNWIESAGHNMRYRFQQGKFASEDTVGAGQWGRTQDDWGRGFTNSNSDLLRADLFPPAYYQRNPRLAERTGIGFQVMKDQTCWPAGPTPGVNRGYLGDTTKPDGTPVKGTLRADGSLQSVTATCGPAIYRGDLFPKEFRGNAFIPEPSGNLVKRLILSEKDGIVTAKNAYEGKEFLTSTDERFRPVNAYTGPDGALYIVDMARGVIQHRGFLTYYLVANIKDRKLETPFNLGRIYRVVPIGAKPKAVKLPRETEKIVPLLAHANGWVRDTAQRVLVERGDAAVAPAVKQVAANKKAAPQARAQALWTLKGLNAVKPDAIAAGLSDPNEKVRTTAVRLADDAQTPALLKLVDDPSAEVRLHLAFKLAGRPGSEVEKAIITLLEKANSSLFAEAVVSGLAGKELEFLEKLLADTTDNDAKLASSGIFGTLASTLMKERKGANVAKLIAIAAALPPESNRQLALLTGMSAKAQKSPPKSAAPNLIKLDAAPPGLEALKKLPKTKLLAGRVERQITWQGKPGAVEVKVVPLTPEQQTLFTKGKTVYATLCGVCHQPTGSGMPGLAPPLLNSEWALGPVDRPIRIVLGGLTGAVEVAGTKWQLEMPGLPILSDEDIAAAITYVRREWEHSESAVSPQEVAAIRAATKSRSKPWTAEDLQKPFNLQTAKAK
ncbi:MAG: DUF6807 family protein [Chthoniobacteraceae bacterium]